MTTTDTERQRQGGLTAREQEVLHWVGEGKSNWEIGQILGCSPGTVKKHLERIYRKIGVENRICAAIYLREKRSSSGG